MMIRAWASLVLLSAALLGGCDDYTADDPASPDDDAVRCDTHTDCDEQSGFQCLSTGVCARLQRLVEPAGCEGEAPAADNEQVGLCADRAVHKICVGGRWQNPSEPMHLQAQNIDGYTVDDASGDCIDNDCDGRTDEDYDAPLDGMAEGVCAGQIRQVCLVNGRYGSPTEAERRRQALALALPDYLPTESGAADCLDNDCDGDLDEDSEHADAFPDAIPESVCFGLKTTCDGGTLRRPRANEIQGYQDCETTFDCRDTDCDNLVDHRPDPLTPIPPTVGPGRASNCSGVRQPLPAVCGSSADYTSVSYPRTHCTLAVEACVDGSVECRNVPQYTCEPGFPVDPGPGMVQLALDAEQCSNGIDDDCDGWVDETCPGGQCQTDEDCCPVELDEQGRCVYAPDAIPLAVTCDTRYVALTPVPGRDAGGQPAPVAPDTVSNGVCIVDSDCADCYFCSSVNGLSADQLGDPPCDERCARCLEVRAVCAELGGACVGMGFEPDSLLVGCSAACEQGAADNPCREGFSCSATANGYAVGCAWTGRLE